MTPAEQIAYLRGCRPQTGDRTDQAITVVCDLAERAQRLESLYEAALVELAEHVRQLERFTLPDVPVPKQEHRLTSVPWECGERMAQCLCNATFLGDSLDAAVRAWVAHAQENGAL
jgi:hypothetical protein